MLGIIDFLMNKEIRRRLKRRYIARHGDKFCGYGCFGILKNGCRAKNFEMWNYPNLEKMVEEANKNKEFIGLHIFKCYNNTRIERRKI